MAVRLVDFSPAEEEMVERALSALAAAGYDTAIFQELVRVEMPDPYRAMSLDGGAALGSNSFVSQQMLNHALEEEYLHLQQKAAGLAKEFGPGTALELELDINDKRQFPPPSA